jgi:hypothetical protein
MKAGKPVKWKLALGLLLLIFSPKHGIFVNPSTPGAFGYDFAGLLWWAFVIGCCGQDLDLVSRNQNDIQNRPIPIWLARRFLAAQSQQHACARVTMKRAFPRGVALQDWPFGQSF